MVTYPADWEKVKLADLIIKGGSGGTPNTSKEEYYKGRIPFLSISDITNSNGYIYRTEKSISELGLNSSAAWIVPAEALTLAMYASVGKVAILKKDIATSQAFYNMIFSGLGTRDFVYYYLKKFDRDNLWNPLISTGTQANLNAKKIRNLEIYLPPLPEQQAIAATLSYFDEHIDNLSELIEKKKAIRDGALEDLLSGRTRLDGFSGEWESIPFSQYFTLLPTNTYSREQLSDSGEIGNIHYGDVLIKYGCVLSQNDYIPRLIDTSKVTVKQYLNKNDVIIADTAEDETVGKAVQIGELNIPLISGLHTIACRPNYQTAGGFLGYYINSNCYHDQLLPYITGIKVSSISKKSIGETELYIPVDPKEQQAIAEVLTAMDEEIESLETEKEKMIQIKEGAMDDLLTGRVRLKV